MNHRHSTGSSWCEVMTAATGAKAPPTGRLPVWVIFNRPSNRTKGPRLFPGRPGILTAVGSGELAIGIDQTSVHQELTGKGRVTQLLQECINLLTSQRPRGWRVPCERGCWTSQR